MHLKKLNQKKFKKKLVNVSNPYFKKNSSSNIVKIIKKIKTDGSVLKPFFDLR